MGLCCVLRDVSTNVAQCSDVEVTRLDLQTLSTCSLNDSVSSIVTPKLRTLLTGLTLTQPRSTVFTNPSIRFRALVLITMASVLSGFIDKPLRSSQCWTARKHSDSLDVELSSLSAMYSCVSSANWAWLTPNELMTFASGEMYSVNSSGPSTDPCGTPYSQNDAQWLFLSDATDYVWHTRYELAQLSARPDRPWVNRSRRSGVLVSRVSNVEDRSSCGSVVLYLLSAAQYTSFSLLRSAVSMLWPRL